MPELGNNIKTDIRNKTFTIHTTNTPPLRPLQISDSNARVLELRVWERIRSLWLITLSSRTVELQPAIFQCLLVSTCRVYFVNHFSIAADVCSFQITSPTDTLVLFLIICYVDTITDEGTHSPRFHPRCGECNKDSAQQLRWATVSPQQTWTETTWAEKWGYCAPFCGRAGSPSNKTSPGRRPTSVTSGILIHPTIWPQYTNVTDREDRLDNGPVAQGEPLYL